MKKQLREQLVTLAKNIVNTKQEQELSVSELKILAQELYEKLTVLAAAENFIGRSQLNQEESLVDEEPAEPINAPVLSFPAEVEEIREFEEDLDEYAPDGTQYNDDEGITEPNTEKIKDIVAQMPPESNQIDEMLEYILPQKKEGEQREEFGGLLFDNLPEFEPVDLKRRDPEKPRSLNDKLKKGIHIGINDRVAFVKHLFDGSMSDYNRVLSQLNTIKTRKEAFDFILNIVKPDYNNWEGKEVYEGRFLDIVDNKFE